MDVSVVRGLLDRADLVQMVDRSLAKRVTVISAPPGSGKTSLLRAWADRSTNRRRIALVSVNRDQQDAQLFWSAVLDAVRSASGPRDPQAQPAAAAAFDADQLVEAVLSELADQVEPVVLIIDDLHELRSADALRQLEHLLAVLPSSGRVVLSSRGIRRSGFTDSGWPTRSPRSAPAIYGSPRARRATCLRGPKLVCPTVGSPRCTSARRVGRPACA
jgi:LuxR family maltose regulon positive regulatory protein